MTVNIEKKLRIKIQLTISKQSNISVTSVARSYLFGEGENVGVLVGSVVPLVTFAINFSLYLNIFLIQGN